MLDLDLDVEADLSIDSIKRVEIVAMLSERLGLRDRNDLDQDKAIEQLATLKTLRSITQWLQKALQVLPAPAPSEPAAVETSTETPGDKTPPPVSDLRRFVFTVERTPAAHVNGLNLKGRHFLITEDALGVAGSLRTLLEAKGALVETTSNAPADQKSPDVIHLASLSAAPSDASLELLFHLSREIVSEDRGGYLLAATGLGGSFGRKVRGRLQFGGVSGFVKSIAKESPSLWARVVDLDPEQDANRLAEHLFNELVADDGLLEVGYTAAGIRQVLQVSRANLTADRPRPLPLDSSSVILLTGGARGITSRVSIALAKRYRCRLELVGRSPMPDGDEDPEIARAQNAVEVRQAIVRQGKLTAPSQIEIACKQILAAREIRSTLAAIREAGATATYHPLDVTDSEPFGALIDSIYARFGRIDGVVHGAGVVDDKLLKHKNVESFRRVFDTKVKGALTLAEKIRTDVLFVIFFSSVIGVFGNRGQSDYAAANEAIDKLACSLAARVDGRVVSINWGPWSGLGMVTPELRREYARLGLPLIDLDAGVNALLNELGDANGTETQVAWLPVDAEAFR
jgi:NAD(P)-dependent dehydrogenase (short-subunit alcohol dehydrogenase family)/acyl carrier protein